jgi:hypothetical protein
MKVIDRPKYRKATRDALNNVVNKRTGGVRLNWSTFAEGHKISNNFGTALQRTGVVVKVKGGIYHSNVAKYINKKTAKAIVDIFIDNNLINKPNVPEAIDRAKAQLNELGLFHEAKKTKVAKPKVTVQSTPALVGAHSTPTFRIIRVSNPTELFEALSTFTTDALLQVIKLRSQKKK